MIRITVQNVGGSNSTVMDIKQSGIIRDMKKAISNIWANYESKRQRIIFGGHEWNDDTTSLLDAGIVSGAIVTCALKGVPKLLATAVANPKVFHRCATTLYLHSIH